ncbi:McrB family protein [Thermoflavimicrobium daqui]|nr:AAA family ATPase [Thermoflavimicrobium daqui]
MHDCSYPLQKEPKVWWVNQGELIEEEHKEGIIWTPIQPVNGRFYYYWGNIIEVEEGDILLHYAKGKIQYVSQVISPVEEFKPKADLGEMGRLVRTTYHALEPAIDVYTMIDLLKGLKIEQGPVDQQGRIKPGYLYRFHLDALRLLKQTHPQTKWPEFLERIEGKKFLTNYTFEELISETNLPEAEIRRWVRVIERKGQAIIYGPPGTGKTFIATRLAHYLLGDEDGFVEQIQFHPAYTYEDFIQGIRPEILSEGQMIYVMKSGRWIEFCQKARERKGRCVLIIDEINRADLSHVFGELLYALEYREKPIRLTNGDELRVPQNVRVIGTMNTSDRSTAPIDFALRRRFAFLRLSPNFLRLKEFHQQRGYSVDGLIQILKQLNQQIGHEDNMVGISPFLVENLEEIIEDIWKTEIEPFVEDYFFDQPNIVHQFQWEQIQKWVKLDP